jgi:hypothetical protein
MIGYGISLALVTANYFFIVFAITIIVGICARVPKEEQMIIKEFGEEYNVYMQRTGRFFRKKKGKGQWMRVLDGLQAFSPSSYPFPNESPRTPAGNHT